MTAWFDSCFDKMLISEGGYVDNPKDPGGETKYGISKRSYPTLNIATLTISDAKDIYRRDYWERSQCDSLPPGLAYLVFDASVNSGVGQAIRFLQGAVGVAADGICGPITLTAVRRFEVGELCARFLGQRLEFLTRLSTWSSFGKGWARRVAEQLKGI